MGFSDSELIWSGAGISGFQYVVAETAAPKLPGPAYENGEGDMYDPQTIQMIVVLVAIAFFIAFVLGLLYGLFLLAKIRREAVGINKRLDELLSRSASGPGNTSSR